ncbi:MAG TPA: branched-chain amino acid ABC transporter substrate-binding protein [Kofleriaceae bacterium]|nr:branched-chain amino acid ABC transporter substrate-binding protein [Kofleriaceae bacterium]
MRNLAAIWAALVLVLGLQLGGCKKEEEEGAKKKPKKIAGPEGTIKIVSSLPRTGSAVAVSGAMVDGIRLALAEADGMAGPFTIVYEDWDDASAKKGDWDPEVEAANADKAVKDPDVMVYIGTYNSGAAKISMPIVNRAGLVMISPGNTYPGLTKPGMGEANEPDIYRPSGKVGFFRVVPADDLQGSVGAKWMKKMGANSVYVLDARDLYGKGIADVFQQTAEDIGLKVAGREGIDPRAQEYKSLMTKIKAADPDFVYFGGTTQNNAGQIAKDLVAVGLRSKFMGPDGCFDSAFITSSGAPNVNDRAFITFGGVPPDQLTGLGANFVKAYQKKYNKMPEAYGVYGYVAAQVALAAITAANKKDREAIRAAVQAYKTEDSALGPFSFDENGDTTMSVMSGNTVKSGQFQFMSKLSNE